MSVEVLVAVIVALAGVAAVLWPIVRPSSQKSAARLPDDAAIETEVQRYRAALRAGTLCARCREANPADSRYCAWCGRALTSAS